MSTLTTRPPHRQRGIALVAAILLLLVITILGVAMFRGYGLQQRIGGNTREKARAFQAALATQGFAEWYLTANNTNAIATTTCSGTVAASTGIPLVCTNVIQANPALVPWPAAFTYTPPNLSTTAGAAGAYEQVPQFYISFIGSSGGGGHNNYNQITGETSNRYQIDAAGWGGAANTVAVVESGFKVTSFATVNPPQAGSSITKNISLGGQ